MLVLKSNKEKVMQSKIIQIHAAEGGADSQMFVADLAQAYLKLSTRKG